VTTISTEVDIELLKIKKVFCINFSLQLCDIYCMLKVQGYIRGFLLRKKFHKLVHDYIKSPHAASRRKRNHVSI